MPPVEGRGGLPQRKEGGLPPALHSQPPVSPSPPSPPARSHGARAGRRSDSRQDHSDGVRGGTRKRDAEARAPTLEAGEPAVPVATTCGVTLGQSRGAGASASPEVLKEDGRVGLGVGGGGAPEAGPRARGVTADAGRPARGRAGAAHPPSATWQALRSWECWGRFTSLSARIFSRARDTNMLLVWLSCMAPARRGLGAPRAGGTSERVNEAAGPASRSAPAASVRAAPSGSDIAAPQRRHVGARHVTT